MFTPYYVSKYLQDQNFEDINNYKLAFVDGQFIFCEWNYDIPPPDLTAIDENQMRADFGLTRVRKIRNDILDLTDKFVLADSPISLTNRTTILYPYRQNLRDIIANIRNGSLPAPIIDNNMQIVNLRDIFPIVPTIPGNYLKLIVARYRWMQYAGDAGAK